MEVTGQILKQNREKSQISLSEVSMATKINLKVLEALESGDKSQLPAPSFLRGFVRTYAKYLKLDETMIMQSFDEEIGNSRPKHQAPPVNEVEAEKPEQIIHSRTLTSKYFAAGTIVILIIAILFIRKVVDKYEKETLLPTTEDIHQIAKIDPPPEPDIQKAEDFDSPLKNPVKDATTQEGDGNKKIAVVGSQPEGNRFEPAPVVPPNPPLQAALPAPTAPSTTPTQSTYAPTQIPTPVAPSPTLVQTTLPPKTVPPTAPTQSTQSPTQIQIPVAPSPTQADEVTSLTADSASSIEDDSRQELIIEALDNTKIQMVLDNGKRSSLNLKASDVHIVKAQSNIELVLTDGGAVSIIHNGQNRGVPGDLGKSLTLNFN